MHFGDSTIIYENKVSKQNIFPWFKGTIESRPHPKFRSIAHSIKKIEPPKAYFIHCIKPAFPGTPIVQPLFLNPQSLVNFANFAQGCIALSYFW
jgi:hypothetical protein